MSPRSRQRKPVTTGFPGHCVATRFSLSRQRGIISCTCERNKSAARSTAHTTRISERDLVFAGEADKGLSRQKISIATDDPQSLCHNKEISIVIGVDRPRVAIEKAVVTGHEVGVAIGFLVTTHGLGLRAHDRARWQAQHKSSVAIEKSLLRQTSQGFMSRQRFLCHNRDFPVATEISLSRQRFPCRDRVFPAPCRDRVSCVSIGYVGWDGQGAQNRAQQRSQRARNVHATYR